MEVFLWRNMIGEACPGSLLWLILLKEFHQLLLSDLKLKSARKVSFVRQYLAQRRLDKRIYKTDMKFWAVLGSLGGREKNLPTAISMQLFRVVFSTFCGKKNIKFKKKNILASALKSCII